MRPFRQGDILFVPVPKSFTRAVGAKTARRRRGSGPIADIIVAEGEATGHHHRIKDVNSRLLSNGVKRFVKTGGDGAIVSHEEHDDLALPGDSTFEIVHQREHEPRRRQSRGGSGRRPATSHRVYD